MIGLGKWAYNVNTVFITGLVTIGISDDNGAYKVEVLGIETDADVPDFRFYDIVEEGDTLKGKGEVSLLPGSSLEMSLTFDGDAMTGYLKVPYLGKIKIKDGKRIA